MNLFIFSKWLDQLKRERKNTDCTNTNPKTDVKTPEFRQSSKEKAHDSQ